MAYVYCMSQVHRIVADSDICGGRPRVRGTRIRVSDILDLIASGVSFEEILLDFPILDREDINEALRYAARSTDHRVIVVA